MGATDEGPKLRASKFQSSRFAFSEQTFIPFRPQNLSLFWAHHNNKHATFLAEQSVQNSSNVCSPRGHCSAVLASKPRVCCFHQQSATRAQHEVPRTLVVVGAPNDCDSNSDCESKFESKFEFEFEFNCEHHSDTPIDWRNLGGHFSPKFRRILAQKWPKSEPKRSTKKGRPTHCGAHSAPSAHSALQSTCRTQK